MKLFTVELTVTAVVMADDERHARIVADARKYDIQSDSLDDFDVIGELKSLDRLPEGWDADCIPYGGDGETRLKDLLPETEPVRDTRTIDMFEEAGSPA
ncbi:hypothetical protein [Cupriavidus pauculus]|uniref:Uncharacterized protein n=1 Tax=Cupriavidus pauculus TaxID=82633 RepID=A0A3G8H3E3_9BURK|nr:hypothetical protein [Cupriavidus pauculus]AZG14968.1 hypothetical protein EHF44_16935 [Cupriavidus pauculus]